MAVVCAAASLTFHVITVFQQAPRLSRAHWEPLRVHRTSQSIAQAVPTTGPVLTLAPLYALEGGRTIYAELSCGSIVFRIGDLMSPQQRRQTHTVGPGTLTDLIKQNPPAAVLLGVETPGYEAPLRSIVDPAWQSLNLDSGLELRLPAR